MRKYAGKEVGLNRGSNLQPAGHESDTLTDELPGWGKMTVINSRRETIWTGDGTSDLLSYVLHTTDYAALFFL